MFRHYARYKNSSHKIAVLMLAAALAGCAGSQAPRQSLTQVESRTQPPKAQVSLMSLEQQRIQHVVSLLDQADQAMKTKRLTTPQGNNAYLYYSQVLQLMPSNEEAHQGLVSIVDRYLGWAQSAKQQGDLAKADTYLQRAAMVLPRDSRVLAAKKSLAAEPVNNDPADDQIIVSQPAVAVKPGYYELDLRQVQQKTPQLQSQLASIADEIYAQKARVQIQAPSDQLGRWLYLQLNNRHEGYRVRANLRIAKSASIRLLN